MNKGMLAMRYCPTKDQIVDILIKVVKEEELSKLEIDMGMMAFDSEVGTTSASLASEVGWLLNRQPLKVSEARIS